MRTDHQSNIRQPTYGRSHEINFMLARSLVAQIHRLLVEGELSHRQIATRLHVSRGTVHNIATGKRGLHGVDPVADLVASVAGEPVAARCPECGHLVHLPCVACRAENYQIRNRARMASVA